MSDSEREEAHPSNKVTVSQNVSNLPGSDSLNPSSSLEVSCITRGGITQTEEILNSDNVYLTHNYSAPSPSCSMVVETNPQTCIASVTTRWADLRHHSNSDLSQSPSVSGTANHLIVHNNIKDQPDLGDFTADLNGIENRNRAINSASIPFNLNSYRETPTMHGVNFAMNSEITFSDQHNETSLSPSLETHFGDSRTNVAVLESALMSLNPFLEETTFVDPRISMVMLDSVLTSHSPLLEETTLSDSRTNITVLDSALTSLNPFLEDMTLIDSRTNVSVLECALTSLNPVLEETTHVDSRTNETALESALSLNPVLEDTTPIDTRTNDTVLESTVNQNISVTNSMDTIQAATRETENVESIINIIAHEQLQFNQQRPIAAVENMERTVNAQPNLLELQIRMEELNPAILGIQIRSVEIGGIVYVPYESHNILNMETTDDTPTLSNDSMEISNIPSLINPISNLEVLHSDTLESHPTAVENAISLQGLSTMLTAEPVNRNLETQLYMPIILDSRPVCEVDDSRNPEYDTRIEDSRQSFLSNLRPQVDSLRCITTNTSVGAASNILGTIHTFPHTFDLMLEWKPQKTSVEPVVKNLDNIINSLPDLVLGCLFQYLYWKEKILVTQAFPSWARILKSSLGWERFENSRNYAHSHQCLLSSNYLIEEKACIAQYGCYFRNCVIWIQNFLPTDRPSETDFTLLKFLEIYCTRLKSLTIFHPPNLSSTTIILSFVQYILPLQNILNLETCMSLSLCRLVYSSVEANSGVMELLGFYRVHNLLQKVTCLDFSHGLILASSISPMKSLSVCASLRKLKCPIQNLNTHIIQQLLDCSLQELYLVNDEHTLNLNYTEKAKISWESLVCKPNSHFQVHYIFRNRSICPVHLCPNHYTMSLVFDSLCSSVTRALLRCVADLYGDSLRYLAFNLSVWEPLVPFSDLEDVAGNFQYLASKLKKLHTLLLNLIIPKDAVISFAKHSLNITNIFLYEHKIQSGSMIPLSEKQLEELKHEVSDLLKRPWDPVKPDENIYKLTECQQNLLFEDHISQWEGFCTP